MKAESGSAAPMSLTKKRTRYFTPATQKWHTRFRKVRTPGQCIVLGCKHEPHTERARLCRTHRAAIFKDQNRQNVASYRKRLKAGKVKHRTRYAGRLTKRARQTAKE